MSIFDSSLPQLVVVADTPFPANALSGPGILIDKTNANWVVSLDIPPLVENDTVTPASNFYLATWDAGLGQYEKIRVDKMLGSTIGIDSRTAVGDANYITINTDRYVGLTAVLTANRTISLLPAASVAGREVTLQDEVGGLSGAHYWIISPTGTDQINGSTSSIVLSTAYGGVRLRSNGSNAWSVIATTGVTALSDSSYTANANDHVIVMTTLSAARSITLPAAAHFPVGQRLTIVDQSGNCAAGLPINIVPAGSDTINGVTGTLAMGEAHGFRGLVSDGVIHWTIVDTSVGGTGGGGGPVHSTDIVDASPLGRNLLTQTTAAQDRTSLGSGLTGDALFQAASAAVGRSTLGSSAVGDAVFIAASQAAAQSALGLGTGATMPANALAASPPASPVVGELWYDTVGGQMYIYYNDGTSSQWVPASNNNPAGVYLPLTGGTMTGPLNTTTSGTPSHIDNAVIGATTPAAATVTSLNGGQLAGMRNLIVNGDMRIDQRNNGAAGTAVSVYTVDRWSYGASQASKGTWQQVAIGIPGFATALRFSSSSAYAVVAADYFIFQQPIEAADFGRSNWGTASAIPLTLSFWAYGSQAGTYGGSVANYANTRSYPFSFTLPAATWTYVSITIPGDTAGTWVLSGNGGACIITFSLGMGATHSAAAGAWTAGNFLSVPGAVSVVATNGAIFTVTGVQVEMGSVATPFERRPIGTEMSLCQRYYNTVAIYDGANVPAGGSVYGSGNFVTMRANPTVAVVTNGSSNISGLTVGVLTPNGSYCSGTATAAGNANLNVLLSNTAEL
jgi:hypothetical protein